MPFLPNFGPRPQRRFKYAFTFGVLSAGALAAMMISEHSILKLVALNAALAFAGVSLGYGALGPRVFGKRQMALRLWSWLVFWPYLALNYFSLWLFRRVANEAPYHEVAPNVLLGCRLWPGDERDFSAGRKAVLDLTAEFPEVGFLQRDDYLCIPILDTTAPTTEELNRGVRFITEHASTTPVYVHCALGHGRSATFVIAYLLASGQAESVQAALSRLQKVRPGVDLHSPQLAVLEAYHCFLHGH